MARQVNLMGEKRYLGRWDRRDGLGSRSDRFGEMEEQKLDRRDG